jgi:DNA-binding NarL/FixJ family response regulator
VEHAIDDLHSVGIANREGDRMPKAGILLADDNAFILGHVRQLLERDGQFNIVASVSKAETIVRETMRLKPDVVVLDISMGEVNGIDVATELRDSGSLSKVVFLTVHDDSESVNAAMGAGGSAYVVKTRLSSDLASAIRAALAGKLFVSPSLMFKEK